MARIRLVSLLRTLYDIVIIGATVYHEVVEGGRKIGAPEVAHVERAMQEGWLHKEEITPSEATVVEHLRRTTRLHAGEAEAIAMAASRKGLLLADDKEARRIAHSLGVKRIGTAGVLLQARLQQHFSMSEFEDAITELTRVSWQSPEVTALILKRAREIQQ